MIAYFFFISKSIYSKKEEKGEKKKLNWVENSCRELIVASSSTLIAVVIVYELSGNRKRERKCKMTHNYTCIRWP
jgi:hypothetical protein